MKKHLFSIALSTIIIASLVSGCSNNQSQTTSSASSTEAPAESVPDSEENVESMSYINETTSAAPSTEAPAESSSDTEEKGEDMPYTDPAYTYDISGEWNTVDPWVSMPYLLDSVKRLTREDMTGEVTFLGGSIYSFISKDGILDQPPSLPVGDNPPETAELYMASTDAVLALKEGDVIALEAIELHAAGALQKIIKIHKTNGDFVHFTTQCPQVEEAFDKEAMKKFMQQYNKNQSNSQTSGDSKN